MPFKDTEAKRAYQRQWMRDKREAWFAGKTCFVCDGTESLELHHVDPAQKINHKIWSWADGKRNAELAKCVPVCHTCHSAHHQALRKQLAELRNPCGTAAAYKRGCKCPACKAANAASQKRLRELAA